MTDTTDNSDEAEEKALVDALREALGDRYEYVSRLGAGAFGEVYCLHDTMLERDVAVKRVRLDAFADKTQRTELRERTIREAKVAAKLKHSHIVTIFDVVDKPDMSFIIMEYIEGLTLSQLLKEKHRLSMDDTVRILGQTASALDFAHKKGVVHRDIKPANIMVEGSSGDAKVTDFGIAKSDNFTELTAAGSVLGTPNYMSPEQARGEPDITAKADLFSFGCVLYECLVGHKAFVGKNVMATLLSIMNESPRPADYEALGLHPALADIMGQALAKDPGKRFSTASEIITILTALPQSDSRDQATMVLNAPSKPSTAPVVTRREPGSTSSFDAKLQGALTSTSVAELVREIYSARNTGILHFERGGVAKRVYFKKGNIVFANSDLDSDRLGEFLIRNEAIIRDDFDRATEAMRESGRRMGTTLIALDILTRERLDELVPQQVQEIIYSIFEWEDGAYGFEFLEKPVEEDIVVDLSTAELILSGIRRMGSLQHIKNALGSLDRVLRHTENPLLLYQKMTLTTSEGYVHSRVDGATSISEIAAISPLGEEETLRCVYALVASGVVELAGKASIPTSRIDARAVRESAIPKPDIEAPPAAKQNAAKSSGGKASKVGAPDAEQKAFLDDIAAKHASLGTASYYDLLEVSPKADAPEIKRGYYMMAKKYHPDRHHLPYLRNVQGLLEELFAKITIAHQELSDPGAKKRYDERLKGASDVGPGGKPASDKATAPAPYTVPPEVMAERRYQQALKHFDNMEYFDAIQCVRDSVRMMPADARYHKLLAKALSKNPHWREEAEFHFLEAMKVDEFDIECLLGLAENYEGRDMASHSTAMYERVLAYDPTNRVALGKLKGASVSKTKKRSPP